MIKFIEDSHQYLSTEDSSVWTSVTQLIHKYMPKKDWDQIAQRYAKKNKLTVEEVKAKWKNENIKAVERGVKFHKQREEDLLSCETIQEREKPLRIFRPEFDDSGNKVSPSQKLVEGIYPELLVVLNSAKICGQADYVIIKDNIINIKDYKTNKAINKNGFVNWEGVEEHMEHPLSGVPNSNYWHYALQLNTYAYMIKKNNPSLKIGTLELLHIKFDETDEVCEIETHILPNMQGFVKSMIEHHKLLIDVS